MLLRYRIKRESSKAQRALLVEFDFPYKFVKIGPGSAEFECVEEKLAQVTRSLGQSISSGNSLFYKVPFEEVPDVASCKVYISQGQAYVAMNQIVEDLSTIYTGPDYSQPKDYHEILLKDIDLVAHSSFPLCMRHLFEKLREDYHLKHGGRMQLGLFLKGVGLKLEDALRFWKAEFSRKVVPERFDKEYAIA